MVNSRSINRSILDSIADCVLILDKDHKIVFVNRAMLALYGGEEKDIVGKDCSYIARHCSIPCFKESKNCSHHEIFKTGKPVTLTHSHMMPDGSERVCEVTASPVKDEDGNVIQIIEIFRDVTEKTIALEVLKKHNLLVSVFDSTEDGVVVIDRDFKILSANKSYLKQTAYSLDDIIGKHCYEVSHHIDKPCYLAGEECSVKNAFETGASHWVIHKHLDKELNTLYVETVSYPLKDSLGNIDSAVEIVRNISEKKKIEEALAKRIKELEEFYEMAVARELKMIELKEEIDRLKKDSKT